jgi:hypothetical protein
MTPIMTEVSGMSDAEEGTDWFDMWGGKQMNAGNVRMHENMPCAVA